MIRKQVRDSGEAIRQYFITRRLIYNVRTVVVIFQNFQSSQYQLTDTQLQASNKQVLYCDGRGWQVRHTKMVESRPGNYPYCRDQPRVIHLQLTVQVFNTAFYGAWSGKITRSSDSTLQSFFNIMDLSTRPIG